MLKYQQQAQFSFLVLTSIFLLVMVPEYWNHSPDSGIYVGTAEELLNSGKYWFNNFPNLQYFPGYSLILTLPISIFGTNFYILQIFSALLAILALWLTREYFSPKQYGLIGILVPLIIACSSLYQTQVFRLLSDGVFLTLSIAILLLWRQWIKGQSPRVLYACFALVAFAPLLRFQGLFIFIAIMLSMLIYEHANKSLNTKSLLRLIVIGIIVLSPFIAWSIRNYVVHTPDTFNMANKFFFGLEGLALYSTEYGIISGLDSWKYPFYNVLKALSDFNKSFFGESIIQQIGAIFTSIITAILILIGSKSWYKSANSLERIYVIISLFYFFGTLVTKDHLHVVPRYWVPLLPFVLVAIGFGFKYIYLTFFQSNKVRFAISSIFAAILIGILMHGIYSVNNLIGFEKPISLKHNTEVLNALASYSDENIPINTNVATTDWGVVPRAVQRTSYPTLEDSSHFESLSRIAKYNVEYLILYDQASSIFPAAARNMIKMYPDAFNSIYSIETKKPISSAEVFKIDINKIKLILNENKQ